MADASLVINIGANVSDAVSGLKQVNATLATTGEVAGQIAPASAEASASLAGIGQAATTVAPPVAAATITIQGMEEELKNLKLQLATAGGDDIIRLNTQIKGVKDALIQARVAGIEPTGESIHHLHTLFEDFGRVITGEGFGLRSIAQNFTLFNPAIIVAVAAIGFLIKKLVELDEEQKEAEKTAREFQVAFSKPIPFNISTEEAKKQIEDYRKVVDGVIETNAKEASQVDILVSRIRAGNLSRSETVDVIKKLQQIAPDYFGKLDTEKASIDQIVNAYNNYNDAITRNIEAQIRIAEITDIVKTRLTSQSQFPDAAKFINDQVRAGKSLDDISKEITQDFAKQQKPLADAYLANKTITSEMEKQLAAQSKIPAGAQLILSSLLKEKEIIDEIKNTSLSNLDIKDTSSTKVDNLKTVYDQILQIENRIKAIDELPIHVRLEESNLNDIKVQVHVADLQKEIRDAVDSANKYAAGTPLNIAFKLKAEDLQLELSKTLNPNLKANIHLAVIGLDADIKASEVESKIAKAIGIEKEIKVKVPLSFELAIKALGLGKDSTAQLIKDAQQAAKENIKPIDLNLPINIKVQIAKAQLLKDIKENFNPADFKKVIEEQLQGIQSALAGTTEKLFANFGDAIGAAISGGQGGLKSALEGFSKIIGEGLKALGQVFIRTGTEIIIAKKALDFIIENPYAAIAVGIALEALGSIIESSITGKKGFAEGGFVEGPGTAKSDSIPARLSAGEFVVNAGAVSQPGVLNALHTINNGGAVSDINSSNVSTGSNFNTVNNGLSEVASNTFLEKNSSQNFAKNISSQNVSTDTSQIGGNTSSNSLQKGNIFPQSNVENKSLIEGNAQTEIKNNAGNASLSSSQINSPSNVSRGTVFSGPVFSVNNRNISEASSTIRQSQNISGPISNSLQQLNNSSISNKNAVLQSLYKSSTFSEDGYAAGGDVISSAVQKNSYSQGGNVYGGGGQVVNAPIYSGGAGFSYGGSVSDTKMSVGGYLNSINTYSNGGNVSDNRMNVDGNAYAYGGLTGDSMVSSGSRMNVGGHVYANGGVVKYFATGGPVFGPGSATSDSIPAMLSHGEFVVRAAEVSKPGVLSFLHNLNSGRDISKTLSVSHFATGGQVGIASGFDNSVSFPLDSLNRQVKNVLSANQTFDISGGFKLAGPDLLLAISRATKNQNLVR